MLTGRCAVKMKHDETNSCVISWVGYMPAMRTPNLYSYCLGVFRRACGKPHTRADNKQLWKSTMFFWNKKVLFETSLKMFQHMKRSFKNNFRREKQVARSFRNFLKTSFHQKRTFRKFLSESFWNFCFTTKKFEKLSRKSHLAQQE